MEKIKHDFGVELEQLNTRILSCIASLDALCKARQVLLKKRELENQQKLF